MQTHGLRASAPSEEQLDLRIGELVEVRSEREILATLHEHGRLQDLLFMPELRQFCGRRFRVYRRAIKACDTIGNRGMYRMEHAVHLEGVRWDGQALRRMPGQIPRLDGGVAPGCTGGRIRHPPRLPQPPIGSRRARCTVARLMQASRAEAASSGEERSSCQATEIPKAAPVHIAGWDLRQYVRDVTSGNARPRPMRRRLLIPLFNKRQALNRRFLPCLAADQRWPELPLPEGGRWRARRRRRSEPAAGRVGRAQV
jgi:hypothetical protein